MLECLVEGIMLPRFLIVLRSRLLSNTLANALRSAQQRKLHKAELGLTLRQRTSVSIRGRNQFSFPTFSFALFQIEMQTSLFQVEKTSKTTYFHEPQIQMIHDLQSQHTYRASMSSIEEFCFELASEPLRSVTETLHPCSLPIPLKSLTTPVSEENRVQYIIHLLQDMYLLSLFLPQFESTFNSDLHSKKSSAFKHSGQGCESS
jgi:hypothetical protein